MGAPEDLVAFCDREWPRLVGALSLYCGDRLVAEEIAQEALLKACDGWRELQQMAAPGAWLHRVAINMANSHYRRRKAERHALQRRARRDVPTESREPADAVAVRRAVARLPARQRHAVVFRFFLQWTVAETAAVMGTSEPAVKSLTYRAARTLREELSVDIQEVDRA